MSDYTIIGANGYQVRPEDFAADQTLAHISGWDDETIGAAAPFLLATNPNLQQRAQQTGKQRVANALSPGLIRPLPPFRLAPIAPAAPAAAPVAQTPVPVMPVSPPPQAVPTSPGPVGTAALPVNSAGTLAAGATQVIEVRPQTIFRTQRLVVGRDLADFFVIQDARAGNQPFFDASGDMPCTSFAPDNLNPNLRGITINPGITITLVIRNVDVAAHPFRATIFGDSAGPTCR